MSDQSVLVVFREQASGHRALEAAAGLGVPLTVVALAPKEEPSSRCGVHTGALDEAIRDSAMRELASARALLGARAGAARFVVLQTSRDEDLAAWAAAAGLRRALLGARRAVFGLRPRDGVARALARAGFEVSVID
ncbi:MAG TPA: hypothetical protein VN740_06055 [Solirubrobacteraceae bacterium]|nr:hypothetical protein [Solirubrobacteraceae bacterium]